jgi:predicted GIY-YIG superfamily endonuclease
MKQLLLFPDQRPLVERLGAEFFQRAPECAGVYVMRGAADEALYVGKARNLRKRLGNYRVANPDRMSRRHLRLVRAVGRIEFHECDSEDSALAKEAALLRNLRPRFNRAGTWPSAPQYFIWRVVSSAGECRVDLGVAKTLEPGWSSLGPLGSWAVSVRYALVRLIWPALFPERGLAGMPSGWFQGKCGAIAAIPMVVGSPAALQIPELLTTLCQADAAPFLAWIESCAPESPHPFEMLIRTADLELLTELASLRARRSRELA